MGITADTTFLFHKLYESYFNQYDRYSDELFPTESYIGYIRIGLNIWKIKK